MVRDVARLGQVLLDRREIFVAAARRLRGGLLQGAVLQELLPVDLARRLFALDVALPKRVVVEDAIVDDPGLWLPVAPVAVVRGVCRALLGGAWLLIGILLGGEDGIAVELFPDFVDQLEP